jgi:hypothetical protein
VGVDPLGILIGGVLVETIGVAGALLAIGLCYLAVTGYGFFNAAFRELDRRPVPVDTAPTEAR